MLLFIASCSSQNTENSFNELVARDNAVNQATPRSSRKRPQRRLVYDIDGVEYSTDRQEEVSSEIARFIASCQLPISIIESDGL